MQPYPVEVETHPTFQDGAFLEDQLYTYNVEQTGYDDGTYLTLWVKNQTGERLAGLHGWSWGGSCYIQDLWVHKDLRGQGYGTQLLHAAEQEARTRGCDHMVLSSFSFQAPGFYQKLGYDVFAVLEDHPRHHRHYYLHKLGTYLLDTPLWRSGEVSHGSVGSDDIAPCTLHGEF
jgi:GNAT superfamily N-acetyltransferase